MCTPQPAMSPSRFWCPWGWRIRGKFAAGGCFDGPLNLRDGFFDFMCLMIWWFRFAGFARTGRPQWICQWQWISPTRIQELVAMEVLWTWLQRVMFPQISGENDIFGRTPVENYFWYLFFGFGSPTFLYNCGADLQVVVTRPSNESDLSGYMAFWGLTPSCQQIRFAADLCSFSTSISFQFEAHWFMIKVQTQRRQWMGRSCWGVWMWLGPMALQLLSTCSSAEWRAKPTYIFVRLASTSVGLQHSWLWKDNLW